MAKKYLSNIGYPGGNLTITPDVIYTTYNVGDTISLEVNGNLVEATAVQMRASDHLIAIQLDGVGAQSCVALEPKGGWSTNLYRFKKFTIVGGSVPQRDSSGNIIGWTQTPTVKLNWEVSYEG